MNNTTMEYKGYQGSVELSEEDSLFYGKVLGIHGLLSYEGRNAQELIADFHDAVDDYLDFCSQEGIEPEKPQADLTQADFNIQLSPELRQKVSALAESKQVSLDHFLEETIENAIQAVG